MSATVKVVVEGGTLADVVAFVTEAMRADLPDDTPVHVGTRITWSANGARLTRLVAETGPS